MTSIDTAGGVTEVAEDPRLEPPRWSAAAPGWRYHLRLCAGLGASAVLAVLYLRWLLVPGRIGNPILYSILVVAELFNIAQALGFWWTCSRRGQRPHVPLKGRPSVDVFIPVYGEPPDIVEATVAAATRLRGADVHVALLDDGGSADIERLARRWGATYIRRAVHSGAKAGNINNALKRTNAQYVAIFDCDHVADPSFLERTLGQFERPGVALVQTPQYYANARSNDLAAAAWAQQALFFGAIARGKDARGSMFCCGTNMVFRRDVLEALGGFPETSVTEDFQLSIGIHERGWRTAYVPEVLASGLGPEDMASYVSQQHRWARGCISALPAIVRSPLRLRDRIQYLLSASYFLTGWTVLVYMSLPVIRILTGAQPLADATADQFLVHFAPYFGFALLAVAVAGAGSYTFKAFALATSAFWVHVHATVQALRRTPGRFVVTPKRGASARQPRAVAPALAAMAVLLFAAAVGLSRDRSPATLNNVAFAVLHVSVLAAGVRPALQRSTSRRHPERSEDVGEAA